MKMNKGSAEQIIKSGIMKITSEWHQAYLWLFLIGIVAVPAPAFALAKASDIDGVVVGRGAG